MLDLLRVNAEKAASVLSESEHAVAFTGAGISVESGIPPFRGEEGLWSRYDPKILELNYFSAHPEDSWKVIKEIFYDFFGNAKPNIAHITLAEMEKSGFLKAVITQNIDSLHQKAGSRKVIEFHGTSEKTVCMRCKRKYDIGSISLDNLPPVCIACGGVLKPDFIFFGEGIPHDAFEESIKETELADVFLLTGSTGLVQPAASLPFKAKQNGAFIIEINPERTVFTEGITDIFIQGKASESFSLLSDFLFDEG